MIYDEMTLGSCRELPRREDVPKEFKWSIEDIYSTLEDWQSDFDKVKKDLLSFEKFKGHLDNKKIIAEYFALSQEISVVLEKIYVWANMKNHEDTAKATYQAAAQKASSLANDFAVATSFVVPSLSALSDDLLNELATDKDLADRDFYFRELLRSKPHILSESEAKIYAQAGELTEVADNVFSMLTNADMNFGTIKDEKGEEVELSEEKAVSFLRSRDRRVRQDAFSALYKPYAEAKNTLGATFDGMLKSSKFASVTHHYETPLHAALFDNNVPISVYDNLINTIENNLASLHRYVALRKQVLKLDEVHMYDLYVPLVENPYGEIPWSKGKEMLLDMVGVLGAEYKSQVTQALADGWCDVFCNKGKRSGAYSWGTYATHPYIFLNHTNRLEDVFTIVHEMGHAMHSFYSHKTQPYAKADYCIFTAEVASTTNEVLLLSQLLKKLEQEPQNEATRQKKIFLLNRRLENIRTTVYRQTMFASFEKEVHNRYLNGEDTTADALCKLWSELNRKYYGTEIVVDSSLEMEWARIPHFYTPFYVYQYATGFSAATAIARGILSDDVQKGKENLSKYLAFLTKGGSDFPINLLRDAGADMESPATVQAVCTQFEETLNEIETLYYL